MVGALSGINMISGSGMLDFLACHSAEKLVLDAEGIAMAKRMIGGVKLHTDTNWSLGASHARGAPHSLLKSALTKHRKNT